MGLTASWLAGCLWVALGMFGVQSAMADGSGNTDLVPATDCMETVAGIGLNCTANDVSVTTATNVVIHDPCDHVGDTTTFTATYSLLLGAQARHDVGIWFSEDGDPNGDGSLTGQCTAITPAYAPDPPWLDLDGTTISPTGTCTLRPSLACEDDDVCFDNQGGGQTSCDAGQCSNDPTASCGVADDCNFGTCSFPTLQDTCGDIDATHNPLLPVATLTTVVCEDKNGNGWLDLPYCSSWRQPGSNELCTSPTQAFPGAPSKCKCEILFEVDVPVPTAPICRILRLTSAASVSPPGSVLFGTASFDATYNNPNFDVVINTTDGMFTGNGLIYNDGQFPLSASCDGAQEECFPTQVTNPFSAPQGTFAWGDFDLSGLSLTPGNASGTIVFTAGGAYTYTGTKFEDNHTGTYEVVDCATVPEPGTIVLMLLPLAGLAAARRRKRS